MVAPQKRGRLTPSDNKRSDGAIEVRQLVRALNKSYEGSVVAGDNIHSFFNDYGYNAIQGWVINDGDGQFKVSFSRDGVVYGDQWTMLPGERTDLNGLDIHSIKITFVTLAANYRIWLI